MFSRFSNLKIDVFSCDHENFGNCSLINKTSFDVNRLSDNTKVIKKAK